MLSVLMFISVLCHAIEGISHAIRCALTKGSQVIML